MNRFKYMVLLAGLLAAGADLFAQGSKVTFNGSARSELFNSKLETPELDTITAPKRNGGYALLDLGVNIQVNEQTEVQGMFRIRNAFGGFWGAGTDFSVRQLYLKGVVAKTIRYQVGDIDQRMTPYTLFNTEQDMAFTSSSLFANQQALVDYDLFYTKDNTWRQQGAATDFGLQFKKHLDEIRFYGMISRAGITDFGANTDKLFAGGNIGIFTKFKTYIGLNHVELFDLLGTAADSSGFKNSVNSLSLSQDIVNGDHTYGVRAELGRSRSYLQNDTTFPDLSGHFWDVALQFQSTNNVNLTVRAGIRNVSADFRSAGAQTKRINYATRPTLYTNFTNDQIFRVFDMVDLMRDVSLYTTQLQEVLMAYNPSYGNVQPYGKATPNRAGSYVDVTVADKKERYELNVEQIMSRQIRGEGTIQRKAYTRTKVEGSVDIGKLTKLERMVKLTAQTILEQTTRDGDEAYEKVDLSSNMIDLGIEVELSKGLDVIAAYRTLTSSGKDNLVSRNANGEIFDFPEYRVELTQTILGGGIRYRFSDKANISAQQMFSSSEDTMNSTFNYDTNMFVLLFTTKF